MLQFFPSLCTKALEYPRTVQLCITIQPWEFGLPQPIWLYNSNQNAMDSNWRGELFLLSYLVSDFEVAVLLVLHRKMKQRSHIISFPKWFDFFTKYIISGLKRIPFYICRQLWCNPIEIGGWQICHFYVAINSLTKRKQN